MKSPGENCDLSFTRRTRLARKLYWVIASSLSVVATLVVAAMYFALLTREAARDVESRGIAGLMEATQLEEQLGRHRRLVDEIATTTAASCDGERGMLDDVEVAILAQLGRADGTLASIHKAVPGLFQLGRDLCRLLDEKAPLAPRTELHRTYGLLADDLHKLVHVQHALRAAETASGLRRLADSAQTLILWVMATGAAAAFLIGPVAVMIVQRVLERLDTIARAMARLAQNDTNVTVPGLRDRDEVGAMAKAVMVFKTNAIELLESKSKLQRLNAQLDAAIGNMPHGLAMFDAEDRLVICNDRYREIFGLGAEATAPGTPRLSLLRCIIASGLVKSDQASRIERLGPMATPAAPTNLHFNDGRIISVTRRPTPEGGWVSVHEDITARCQQEARIAHLAGHDSLTGLANRHLLRERMAAVFGRTHRTDGMAVHCLDLDGFKAVNDAQGHQVGDQLLKLVGARLLDCVRAADVVARMGGDEFAIVQMGVGGEEAAEALARRIVDQISKPYVVEGCEIVVGASVGVAIGPHHGNDADQLLKNADMALYCVKANGRGTYAFFDPSMDAKVQQRRALEADLRAALGKGEFELHYQPIVALETGAVLAFEALMRWRHPTRGLVSPADFVPLAEEVGLIVPMGEWVIETACREAASWSAPYRVAVNLSPIQFRSARLLETVEASLRHAGLDASRLELEITESTMLQDSPATLAALHHLHGLGVSIGMDDFGTGYSSLSYLRSFPFDKIKIDKAFIRDIHDGADAGAIVEAVVTLARSLNMVTLAEGVETVAQCDAVRRAGCQQAQGFLFSRPVPSSEIAAVLARLALPEQKVA